MLENGNLTLRIISSQPFSRCLCEGHGRSRHCLGGWLSSTSILLCESCHRYRRWRTSNSRGVLKKSPMRCRGVKVISSKDYPIRSREEIIRSLGSSRSSLDTVVRLWINWMGLVFFLTILSPSPFPLLCGEIDCRVWPNRSHVVFWCHGYLLSMFSFLCASWALLIYFPLRHPRESIYFPLTIFFCS